MIDFVIAAGWILHRRYEAGIETPKRDKVDQLVYKTEIADQLLAHEHVDYGVVEDGIDDLPHPESGVAKKRKKPTPLPTDATKTRVVL